MNLDRLISAALVQVRGKERRSTKDPEALILLDSVLMQQDAQISLLRSRVRAARRGLPMLYNAGIIGTQQCADMATALDILDDGCTELARELNEVHVPVFNLRTMHPHRKLHTV